MQGRNFSKRKKAGENDEFVEITLPAVDEENDAEYRLRYRNPYMHSQQLIPRESRTKLPRIQRVRSNSQMLDENSGIRGRVRHSQRYSKLVLPFIESWLSSQKIDDELINNESTMSECFPLIYDSSSMRITGIKKRCDVQDGGKTGLKGRFSNMKQSSRASITGESVSNREKNNENKSSDEDKSNWKTGTKFPDTRNLPVLAPKQNLNFDIKIADNTHTERPVSTLRYAAQRNSYHSYDSRKTRNPDSKFRIPTDQRRRLLGPKTYGVDEDKYIKCLTKHVKQKEKIKNFQFSRD